MSVTRRLGAALIVIGLAVGGSASAQEATEMIPAPERADQGDGPFERLIIRGVIVIDGAGAPPQGPIDLVIEGNRIAEVRGGALRR